MFVRWRLMGGFVVPDEGISQTAERILTELTGLHDVYLEQLESYGDPDRDPIEWIVSVAYFALIDINKYQTQISDCYQAEWIPINATPALIFDHDLMVNDAKKRVSYKAALHPILFQLLPLKFTIPQLQNLIVFLVVLIPKISTLRI